MTIPGGPASAGSRLGYVVFLVVLAAGAVAASVALSLRVVDARGYYGWLWVPGTIVGVAVGAGLPLLGVRAWRARKVNLAGAFFVLEALAVILGVYLFGGRPVSPAGRPASGAVPWTALPRLCLAALGTTAVIVACVTILVLAVASLREKS